MIRWIKSGKVVNAEGTTITYEGYGTQITVESRKRHVPHTVRAGTWDFTTYHVLLDGKEVGQYYSLRSAKEHAERLLEKS